MKVIDLVVLLALLVLIGIGFYILYLNLPSQTVYYKEVESKFFSNASVKNTYQFYPYMRYKNKEITFSLDNNCDSKKRDSIYESRKASWFSSINCCADKAATINKMASAPASLLSCT